VAVCLSTVIALKYPFEDIMPAYRTQAEMLSQGKKEFGFLPVGYSLLMANWTGLAFSSHLKMLQLIFLWGTWLIFSLAVVKSIPLFKNESKFKKTSSLIVCLGICSLFLNPYFLIGVIRVSDNGLNIFLLAILFYCILALETSRSLLLWIVSGLTLGYLILVRPNAVSLIPVFFISNRHSGLSFRSFLFFLFTALLVLCAVSFAVTGQPFYWPANGGYNLFAGNNPYSFSELISNYNAEYSLDGALKWCGLSENRFTATQEQFVLCTRKFLFEEPTVFFQTTLYKIFNLLFRPNLRLADTTIKSVVQVLLVIPAYCWWFSFVCYRKFRKSWPGTSAFWLLVFYSIPFVFTNTDPRFRIPLDTVYILSGLSFILLNESKQDSAQHRSSDRDPQNNPHQERLESHAF